MTTVTMATTTTSTTRMSRTQTMVSLISGKPSPPLLNPTTTTTSTMTMNSYMRCPNTRLQGKNMSIGSSTALMEYTRTRKRDTSPRRSNTKETGYTSKRSSNTRETRYASRRKWNTSMESSNTTTQGWIMGYMNPRDPGTTMMRHLRTCTRSGDTS